MTVKSRKLKVERVLIILMLMLQGPTFALTLDESIDIAMSTNPQVKAAKEAVNVSSAKMGEAGSMMIPNVSVSASKGKNYQQPMVFIFGGVPITTGADEPADATSYSLNVSQNLFTGGKILQAISAARLSYDMALESLKMNKDQVTYNVISSYLGVLKAKKMLDITEQTIKRLGKQVKQVQYSYDSGLSSKADLLMAQTQLATVQIQRIGAKGGVKLSILGLQSVLGTRVSTAEEFADEKIGGADETPLDENSILQLTFKNRPEWRSYELAIKIANQAVGYSWGGYLPMVSFMYSTGRTKAEYQNNPLYNTDLANWRAMFVGQWNIFDGMNTPNKVREAYASLNQAKAQEQGIRDMIVLDVQSSITGVDTARQTLSASKVADDLARKSYEYTEIAYKTGLVSNLNYLDAQIAYNRAETTLWSSMYDLETAKAKLNKAVGTKIL